ncbi:S-adenosyl-L-methionine-dependent methyltransferase [Blyttiomyces helicus]|uniref:S-adenosyl-L-methionine-dependent methyltransferase n=1 Tax=Blyttiomyces helicus TaxID=388810 RepID=A0A4V1ISI5_9FUNG|nr:S-adenosyl-L-methionine-dependent methyltransferase [Blyttiomyces helicus]|eukprot:RKO93677.1 S-adenosyl-L-methionine-dependent methyltransferase [Blyttiomyces helicus]
MSVVRRINLASIYEPALESGLLPDAVLRTGIRYLLSRRVAQCQAAGGGAYVSNYVKTLRHRETIAECTKEANEQHYEVPTEFFQLCLGKRMKYSSCLYENGAKTLEEAEDAMLDLYVQRAEIEDGMSILDLGCGWGSLSLYLAERFPNSKITGLSNSHGQREHILRTAKERGFSNVEVLTGDINEFKMERTFDRIISIEMLEHMKNYASLLSKVSKWLVPSTGRLFVHVFAHKNVPYDFKTEDDNSWMAKYFFTGGTMPSEELLLWFQDDLVVKDRWTVNGKNYGQTSEEWLKRMDANKAQIMPIFTKAYGGAREANIWFQRWRVFYLSVAELFNYNDGQEWVVSHMLFSRR